jgi:hypothetical protein
MRKSAKQQVEEIEMARNGTFHVISRRLTL